MSTRTNGGDKRREKYENAEHEKKSRENIHSCLSNKHANHESDPKITKSPYRRRCERPTNATTTVPRSFGHSHSIQFSLCSAGARMSDEKKKKKIQTNCQLFSFFFLLSMTCVRREFFFRSLLFCYSCLVIGRQMSSTGDVNEHYVDEQRKKSLT